MINYKFTNSIFDNFDEADETKIILIQFLNIVYYDTNILNGLCNQYDTTEITFGFYDNSKRINYGVYYKNNIMIYEGVWLKKSTNTVI